MKKFLFIIFSSFFFFSCASVHVPIPGETEVKKNNIYVEYMNIADAYNDLGKYDKAITYYSYAMKNKSLYWTAFYKLGRSYALNKNWQEAEKVYLKLLKRDSENVSLKMSLAYIYAMNGNLKGSEQLYEELNKNNPDNSDILVNYINVLFAEENYEKAKEKTNELKEKFKDNKNIETFEKKLEELEDSDSSKSGADTTVDSVPKVAEG